MSSCRAFPDFPVPGNGKFIIPYAPYFMVPAFSFKPASKLSKSFFQIFFLHGLLYTILWTESITVILSENIRWTGESCMCVSYPPKVEVTGSNPYLSAIY